MKELIGDWFISISCWDGAHSITASASAGKWHKNKKGKVVYEGAKKRVSYYQNDIESKNKAIGKLREFINAKISEAAHA